MGQLASMPALLQPFTLSIPLSPMEELWWKQGAWPVVFAGVGMTVPECIHLHPTFSPLHR